MISVFLQLDDFRELKIRRFHSTSYYLFTIHKYIKSNGYCYHLVIVISFHLSQSDHIKRLPLYYVKLYCSGSNFLWSLLMLSLGKWHHLVNVIRVNVIRINVIRVNVIRVNVIRVNVIRVNVIRVNVIRVNVIRVNVFLS
jgi:hypothetical protein